MERQRQAYEVLQSPRGRYFCDAVAVETSFLDPAERLVAWKGAQLEAVSAIDRAEDLIEPMGWTMDAASYWGEHHGDAEVRTEQERILLTGIIEAVLSAPAMNWWSEPFDATQQFLVANEFKWTGFDTPPLEGPLHHLAAGQRRALTSSQWWSTPLWHSIISTRPLGTLPALELQIVEDRSGPQPSQIFQIMPTRDLRIYEVDGPADWVHLVQTHPLDVTEEKHASWCATTGIVGTWYIPDWAAVAENFDVVHLTGMGYLTTAGRPLRVEDGYTLMAGFSPDQAFWLTDSFHFPNPGVTWRPAQSVVSAS